MNDCIKLLSTLQLDLICIMLTVQCMVIICHVRQVLFIFRGLLYVTADGEMYLG